MNRFTFNHCVTHSGEDVVDFVKEKLCSSNKVLFIGTVGMDATSLYYPYMLSSRASVDYKFLIENRPFVADSLKKIGKLHQRFLAELLGDACVFEEIKIIADDEATIAGRSAVRAVSPWLQTKGYSDIVIDSTGMSRGTSFPVIKQAVEAGLQSGINVHLLNAAYSIPILDHKPESDDRAEWMHGFQGQMDSDRMDDALKLWVPQLSEDKVQATSTMYKKLFPVAEVCPILPFPSQNPRRGDNILFEYQDALTQEWGSSLLNIIYAHESNPLDVYRSVSTLHGIREQVFQETGEMPVTILSPAGWRIGSLGMLLAAIELNLPVLYVETLGYTSDSGVPAEVMLPNPDLKWHIWLTGDVYKPN
ncbi:hypothetical protein A1507_18635 [Methylomonas koyamae]|uniref:Uncharacterized protein n=1 Tax=Methylomonas koyamae TaxID=702114 RepID=A0A177N449_9GAMM|nr:hypothetical protein [Methylomonas koyamae]OAI12787.1 hypothetical protein A1507_18635 [Methylomonas koyamae]